MAFGTALRNLRRQAFMTCAEAGALAGCDARTIVDIEDGNTRETREIYEALVERFPPLATGNPKPPPVQRTAAPVSQHVLVHLRRMEPLDDALADINVGPTNRTRIFNLVMLCRHADYTDAELRKKMLGSQA